MHIKDYIQRNIREKSRGYILVEAAIFIPVFLFSAVLLIYILKMLHFQEIIHFEAGENLANMTWESQIIGSEVSGLTYGARLNGDVSSKINKAIHVSAGVSVRDEVINVDLSYPIDLSLPFGLYDDFIINQILVARKWSGADKRGEVQGFEAMEKNDDCEYVFIFPKYGERYHEGGCFYLVRGGGGSKIECVAIGDALGRGYTKCKVCH